MNQQSEDESGLRRYLLGELTQEERSEVEERLFLNSDYFQQLQAEEDDLLDDYIYEELSITDRENFEKYFLSAPGRREDIKIARALKRYISTEAEPVPSTLASVPAAIAQPPAASTFAFLPSLRNFSALARLALAAAAVIILAIGIWLVIKAVRSREQSQPLEVQRPAPHGNVQALEPREEMTTNVQPDKSPKVEQERRVERQERRGGLEEEQVAKNVGRDAPQSREPSSQSKVPRGSTLAVMLVPGSGVRGGGDITSVLLSPEISYVKLDLPLLGSNNYRTYQAALRLNQSYGKAIRTWDKLQSAGTKEPADFVSVTVPSKLLRPANYQMKLSGLTAEGKMRDIATYVFQVKDK